LGLLSMAFPKRKNLEGHAATSSWTHAISGRVNVLPQLRAAEAAAHLCLTCGVYNAAEGRTAPHLRSVNWRASRSKRGR